MATEALPRWDLSNVYPGLGSPAFLADTARFTALLESIDRHHDGELAGTAGTDPLLGARLGRAVDLFNEAWLLSNTLSIYIDSFVTTDSYNKEATRRMSELEITQVRLRQAWTRFQKWLCGLGPALPAALESRGSAHDHTFILKETAEQGVYLMGAPEEMLAAELSLSGANAWSKLQRTVTSQIVVDFPIDGEARKLPMPALINLRSHPDEAVRRRAWEAEIAEWEKVREPLAACLNGVKGSSVILNRRRGRSDCLHAPIDQARIDRATLDALVGAMQTSLPGFRRYFAAKARRLGKEKLAWWDLFAPTGKARSTYTWSAARDLVLDTFGAFSPRLRSFAERAFDARWIDAEPRDGKQGGGLLLAGAGREGIAHTRELRRLARAGLHRGPRARARLSQRLRLSGGEDRAAADHADDPRGDRLHHV